MLEEFFSGGFAIFVIIIIIIGLFSGSGRNKSGGKVTKNPKRKL